MLIQTITAEGSLSSFLTDKCEDNSLSVIINIPTSNYIVIKPDEFYKNEQSVTPKIPRSVDCIIVIKCSEENTYKIYLVELKNVNKPGNINNTELEEKFESTLMDFLYNRYKNIFFCDDYKTSFKLYLCAGKVTDVGLKPIAMDFLLGLKTIKIFDKYFGINGWPPELQISPC